MQPDPIQTLTAAGRVVERTRRTPSGLNHRTGLPLDVQRWVDRIREVIAHEQLPEHERMDDGKDALCLAGDIAHELRELAEGWAKDVEARRGIVCLCGSTKFKREFRKAEARLAMEGVIVLSVGLFGHADSIPLTAEEKAALDELHKRKIDLCEEVHVLNVGGYIGESTRSEIAYAESIGRRVSYLEPARLSDRKEAADAAD